MRCRLRIGGLQTAAAARDQYRLLGENVAKLRTDLMKEQLSTFRSQLQDFARKHKNPAFRSQFHEMCAKVGVDPLASNQGFWAELLGIGDFYYELGVQIVDICLATRPHNGGLINLEELCKILSHRRKGAREAVSEDDCLRAISKLKVLGSVFEVITVGKRKLVRSVPTELKKDHNEILELSQAQGFVTVEEVERRLSWSTGRATDALESLLDVLKQENISYVVAPYEADAQMTFLAITKHVDDVITEDPDLIPFGCPRIIYKMDKYGQGPKVLNFSTRNYNRIMS